jgi:hypothetical protein
MLPLRRKQLYRVDSRMSPEEDYQCITVHINPETFAFIKTFCAREMLSRPKFVGDFLNKYIMEMSQKFLEEEQDV